MKEDVLLKDIDALPPSTYIQEARTKGRMNMSPGIRGLASRLHEAVLHYRRTEIFLSAEAASTLELAGRVFYGEWFLARNPRPRYLAYTNVRVLNWVLETNRLMPVTQVMQSAWRAIGTLVDDLEAFELRSLAGMEKEFQEGLDVGAVLRRLDKLSLLEQLIPCRANGPASSGNTGKVGSWMECATDPSRLMALVGLTALPQTPYHDEVLFLRTIHLSECCFWGVLVAVTGAMEEAKRSRLATATRLIEQGVGFAQFLVPLIEVMKTMPPEAFRAFRDATGDASAIQSRIYQRMQINLQGLDPSKTDFLKEIPELSDLLLLGHPNFKHLKKVVQQLTTVSSDLDALPFLEAARTLDEALFGWRKLHLGVAKKYLADLGGSGGTPGFRYLKAHYAHKVFSTEPGGDPVEELAATGTHGAVSPLLGPTN